MPRIRETDQLPTVERLRELFDYDPETGYLTWRASHGRARAGARAGCLHPTGYARVKVGRTQLEAHRIAWAMHTGSWPPVGLVVDHINGIGTDNRIANLRPATNADNIARSVKAMSSKRSALPRGVYRARGRFRAQGSVGGKLRHLGNYSTAEEAAAAYRAFVVETRGEFAPAAYRNS